MVSAACWRRMFRAPTTCRDSTTPRWTASQSAPPTPRARARGEARRRCDQRRVAGRHDLRGSRSQAGRRSRSRPGRWCRGGPTRSCGSRTAATRGRRRRGLDEDAAGEGGPPGRRGHPRRASRARAGHTLGPAELGVLASVGAAEVTCARRPRVAVLATGDELVEPGRAAGARSDPQLEPLLGAGAGSPGGRGADRVRGRARRPGRTVEAVEAGLDGDVLIVCGGVSVGPHDHVKPAFAALGVEEVFWGVALRPGHPTWFGNEKSDGLGVRAAGQPRVGDGDLPPVRAAGARRAAGCDASRRSATAVMDKDYREATGPRARRALPARGTRRRLARAPTKEQGSHILTSMLGRRGARAARGRARRRGGRRAGSRECGSIDARPL